MAAIANDNKSHGDIRDSTKPLCARENTRANVLKSVCNMLISRLKDSDNGEE